MFIVSIKKQIWTLFIDNRVQRLDDFVIEYFHSP